MPLAVFGSLPDAPDPDDDVDNDDNGGPVVGFGVATSAVTLSFDGETLGNEDGDSDVDTNLTVDFGFEAVVDLAIDKSDSGMDVAAGDNYVYTLEVTNNGPSGSTGGTVTDTLPAGWTFVSATGGTCLAAATGFTCTVGALANGAMQTFIVTVAVPSSAAVGTVTNSASVAANETDSTPGNNTDTEMTTVVVETDLAIDKSDSGMDVAAGDNYVYTLEVTNNGPSGSTGGTVTDTLPAGWTFVSATGGTCSAAATGFTCTVGALANGAMQTFMATVAVPAGASAGTVTNSASVAANETDSTPGNNTDTEMTTVVVETDLAIDKSDSGMDVAAGENYVYTLEVTNNGPSGSTGGTVTDTLPAGWTFVSATGGTCSAAATGFTCTVGALANGAMQTFMATVAVPAGASAATVTNSASVTANETDSTPGNNTDTEMTTVVVETDLAIDKSDSGMAVAGENYPYTLEVTNNGPSDSTGGTVTDTLPAGWTYVSATGGTCMATATGFTCAVGALANGAMQTFIVTVAVPSSAAVGMVTNSATVVANETDSTTGNDIDTEMTDVIREVDLEVTKTESVDPVLPGVGLPGNLTYVVTVKNNGPSDVSGVTVSEDLAIPAPDVTVDSVTPSAGSFTPTTAPDGTWDGFDLAAGASATLTVVISAGPLAPVGTDNISNTATAAGTGGGETLINLGDDTITVKTSVAPLTPTFTKAFTPAAIGEGSGTTLIFTIDNSAISLAASSLDFTDNLPAGVEVAAMPNVVSTCAGATTAIAGTSVISHTGGTVGAASSCTIAVDVFAPSAGMFVNVTGDLTSSAGNSGTATDTLTAATCLAADGPALTLESDVVLTAQTHEVCNTISVKQHYLVLGPNGVLTLRAGFSVAFFNGVEIGTDGELAVEIDPGLMP